MTEDQMTFLSRQTAAMIARRASYREMTLYAFGEASQQTRFYEFICGAPLNAQGVSTSGHCANTR